MSSSKHVQSEPRKHRKALFRFWLAHPTPLSAKGRCVRKLTVYYRTPFASLSTTSSPSPPTQTDSKQATCQYRQNGKMRLHILLLAVVMLTLCVLGEHSQDPQDVSNPHRRFDPDRAPRKPRRRNSHEFDGRTSSRDEKHHLKNCERRRDEAGPKDEFMMDRKGLSRGAGVMFALEMMC